MRTRPLRVVWPLFLAAIVALPSSAQGQAAPAPLYADLGNHRYPISAPDPTVQAYFDQGLRLYYAFNHLEAIRSFREAQRLDETCAICWWGEALSWGPNINLAMDSLSGVAAYAALEGAVARRDNASEAERELIDALTTRYESVPPVDRRHLDEAYAEAMRGVASRLPDDPEVSVLFGESLMDLRPWDYWTPEGELQPGMAEALGAFESVLARNPDHPGACHFFIHAVERVQPERAVPCAERLASLMPGAGHLVHMPAHIYVRVGRFREAVDANTHAVHADETYIQDQRPDLGMYTAGYYPHNYDFMAFAASMIGRSAEAVAAAEQVATVAPMELLGVPGMDFLQHWTMRSALVRVRFALWDEILATPAPPPDRVYSTALWRYARGRALAASGDVAGAAAELDAIRTASADPALAGMRLEYNEATALLGIAARVLAGSIARADGRPDEAVDELTEAVRLEDALRYGEPPEWTVPPRQDLGATLLDAGRPAEAERVFREDLARFPANGWSLRGLMEALRAQGRAAEADRVEADFRDAWSTADVDAGAVLGL